MTKSKKRVREIVYLDSSERSSEFSTGFKFILEDGTEIETMTTDFIAYKVTSPTPTKRKRK